MRMLTIRELEIGFFAGGGAHGVEPVTLEDRVSSL